VADESQSFLFPDGSPARPSAQTPMMKQYFDIKKQHPDKLLMFRLGDFYEFFFDDARTAARELNLTLTSRHSDIPMCGIPFHAADNYVAKLVQKGFKLAVCDQVEDPKLAKTLVRREVTSIITPGTVTNLLMLNDRQNNWLVALWTDGKAFSAAFADISTGDIFVSACPASGRREFLDNLLSRFQSREVLCSPRAAADGEVRKVLKYHNADAALTEFPEWQFEPSRAAQKLAAQYGLQNLKSLGLEDRPDLTAAAGAALAYMEETQRQGLAGLKKVRYLSVTDSMYLDRATIRNLELVANSQDGSAFGSLLSVVDRTLTSVGARLLRSRLLQPLLDVAQIDGRLDRVGHVAEDSLLRGEVRGVLKEINDLERLATRVALKKANPKELVALRNSLAAGQKLLDRLRPGGLYGHRDTSGLTGMIASCLADDPPLKIEDGGVVRQGFDAELDKVREAQTKGRQWILDLEEAERRRTRISSLKIRFNNIFGYYIEVTKPNLPLVPADYIRKQTLANAERFTNQKLQEYETLILSAEEKVLAMEKRIFDGLLDRVTAETGLVQDVSREVARIDVDSSLAELAKERNYRRPEVRADAGIEIREGRHPVVEALLASEAFVPNDLVMDASDNRLFIITGPNMAGKSTYLRQNALIILMAQAGSFVPAARAVIGLVDKVFTRVGASDNLVRGESTFLVEMQETANILNNATDRSFLVMDEIGRGTSTYDGLSIAWSIVEHIAEAVKARTLFATHYHEMTVLGNELKGVKNFNILVKEWKDEIVFLRKIEAGSADRSYGIQVAKLAGLPGSVVNRAKQILLDLEADTVRDFIVEQKKAGKSGRGSPPAETVQQLRLFSPEESELIRDLKATDENGLTPVEALNLVARWKKKLKD
jgi:DNA mismatch repair protein MutS